MRKLFIAVLLVLAALGVTAANWSTRVPHPAGSSWSTRHGQHT